MADSFSPELSQEEDSADAKAIANGILEHNNQFRPRDSLGLTIAMKDQGKVIAGLTGSTASGWLFVKFLWVNQGARKSGLGSKLLLAAEAEALRRGCHSVWLDTFSFQARGFYEKLGYSVFGTLDNYPAEHQRFFMQKRLRA